MRLFYTQEALLSAGIRNRETALAFPSLPILSIWSTTSSTSLLPRDYADGSRRAVMRKFPFVVVYTVEGDAVVITAIFHTSRNPVARDR